MSPLRHFLLRWLIPFFTIAPVALGLGLLSRVFGGPEVVGFPWWQWAVEFAWLLWATWWTFIAHKPMKDEEF